MMEILNIASFEALTTERNILKILSIITQILRASLFYFGCTALELLIVLSQIVFVFTSVSFKNTYLLLRQLQSNVITS